MGPARPEATMITPDTFTTEHHSSAGCHPDGGRDLAKVCEATDTFEEPIWMMSNETNDNYLIPNYTFGPYVRLFFERLYPIFPVFDRETLEALVIDRRLDEQRVTLSKGQYALLTSLSAAVIVQLNLADQAPGDDSTAPSLHSHGGLSAEFFIFQCLETRRQTEYIEEADEWTILTSFFLFAYYGNMNQPQSAWYYLREAMSFAEVLGLTDLEMYEKLDTQTQERQRQIFWLLFITER